MRVEMVPRLTIADIRFLFPVCPIPSVLLCVAVLDGDSVALGL